MFFRFKLSKAFSKSSTEVKKICRDQIVVQIPHQQLQSIIEDSFSSWTTRKLLSLTHPTMKDARKREWSISHAPTWISAITKHLRIVAVVQKVLDVCQLMVNGYKVFMRYVGAHFDSVNMKSGVCNYMQMESNRFDAHEMNYGHLIANTTQLFTDNQRRCRNPMPTADTTPVYRLVPLRWIAPKTLVASPTCSLK